VIEEGAELIQCHIISTPSNASFSFGAHSVSAQPVVIGAHAKLHSVRVENSVIGEGVVGERAQVKNSVVGAHSHLRCHGNLVLTHTAAHANLGSEVSKSLLLGQGFVSEHTASYLSLVAPGAFPLLTHDGKEELRDGLPNLTNIGAGTVFANYSGKPKPANSLDESSGSQKGTAVVYGAFTAVNAIIVNRYGRPSATESPFDWARRSDLTTLGLGCLVERKVAGRVPAFSYASSTSTSQVKIGWVLEQQPGIVLNIVKKMRKKLKGNEHLLQDVVEGTIRLECALLEEQQNGTRPTWMTPEQIEHGLAIYKRHLDGRWAIGDHGSFVHTWSYDHLAGKWACPR
jgi:hypothetical protein